MKGVQEGKHTVGGMEVNATTVQKAVKTLKNKTLQYGPMLLLVVYPKNLKPLFQRDTNFSMFI